MKEIKLTQGKVTLVDDEDYEYLNQFKWYADKKQTANMCTYYAIRKIHRRSGNKTIAMHRLILGLSDPKIHGDHRDGDGLNNQRYNLRPVTVAQNQHNQKISGVGSSKYKGVCFHKRHNKFIASIMYDKLLRHLGYFENQDDAAIAYNNAAIKYYGEFAKLNIITP